MFWKKDPIKEIFKEAISAEEMPTGFNSIKEEIEHILTGEEVLSNHTNMVGQEAADIWFNFVTEIYKNDPERLTLFDHLGLERMRSINDTISNMYGISSYNSMDIVKAIAIIQCNIKSYLLTRITQLLSESESDLMWNEIEKKCPGTMAKLMALTGIK